MPPPITEERVREAGGTWNTVICSDGTIKGLTSATNAQSIPGAFGNTSVFSDGMSVVFSWPVLPTTVHSSDFEIVLNSGEIVVPDGVSMEPNHDFNERNTIVVISPKLGNRKLPSEEDAKYPILVRIVEDDTPLQLVGPNGPVSAVGLSYNITGHPYANKGPRLCGAKISHMNIAGDNGPIGRSMNGNDGVSLYGSKAQFRLRMLITGGYSPDGVQPIKPNDFEKFFQVAVSNGTSGTEMLLTETNKTYMIDDTHIEIVGLAELGVSSSISPYDDCYEEDRDNQIDIVLSGHEEAMRKITAIIVPADDPYVPLYNPGGPGRNPTLGVRYTQPSQYWRQPVTIALDDPMTVSYTGRVFNADANTYQKIGKRMVKVCARPNKRSMGCGAKGGKLNCCPGLVCHMYQTYNCVKEQYKSCSGHNQWAAECGSDIKIAAPKCCDGFTCNGKKCSKQSLSRPSDTPSPSFQPTNKVRSSSLPSNSLQPSENHSFSFQPSDAPSSQSSYPAYCAAENERSRSCGGSGGKDTCCPGLVCHKHQNWKCVQDQFKKCAGRNMYAKECGSKWYQNGSPKCCDGLTCEDQKCVQFTHPN